MAEASLVMLPGLLLDQRLFAAQIDALGSSVPVQVPDLGQDASIGQMAERVLAAAPARFALCALSMGGYVAFEIMRQAPERVTRLALLDTQARPDTEAATQRRRDLIALSERGYFKGVTSRLLPQLIHPDQQRDAALVAAIHAMAISIGKDGFVRQQQAIMGRPDSRPDLPGIGCRTLVLCGRQDLLTPPELHEEMAAAIPDASLVVLPQCGHLSPLEQPALVTAHLRWWLTA